MHNKQQHCLGRKHNEEIVMFVQNSVNMHQKKNKSLSSNVNSENHAPNSENHIEDHLDSDTSLMDLTVERTCDTEDSVKDNENINVGPISNTEDCMIVVEDHLSNANHHMSCTEHHVSSTKDHMSRTEGSTAGKHCHPSSPEYNNNSPIINCSENTANCSTVISCHESNTKCPTITTCNESTTNYSTVLTCSESTTNCSTVISCSESTTNCTLVQPNALADCTDILTTISNIDSSEDHVSVTNSCACSSTDLTNNDDNVFVQEHNQPIVHFPPFYSLNHMIHDFKLHQQG